jgi:hypothetical protein
MGAPSLLRLTPIVVVLANMLPSFEYIYMFITTDEARAFSVSCTPGPKKSGFAHLRVEQRRAVQV